MEALVPEVARLLNDTLSPEKSLVSSATDGLQRLSLLPDFPSVLIALTTGGNSQGQKLAAATYLKNFTKRYVESDPSSPKQHNDFRNQLVQTLLQTEPAILKILAESFHYVIVKDFVKANSWPELIPELKSVIVNSNLVNGTGSSQWKTINALTALQVIAKQFQYFLNPKIPKEPVPLQLELMAKEILVPLQSTFHHFLNKVLAVQDGIEIETEQVVQIICKCIYFSVRSYMPFALIPTLPSFCMGLYKFLDSLKLDDINSEDGYSVRLKIGKRILVIFNALVTRHRKHADKLMPNMMSCASKIVKQNSSISRTSFLSERIVSLAFDVISHVLETGPGWRIVSPHFSSLLDSAIFPALVLNDKDMSLWEEDQEEYIRRNFPSDLEDISGWNEDLFTARKSAMNLLGVIALSKGPPMASHGKSSLASAKRKKGEKNKGNVPCNSIAELLVIPYLSKFPIPSGGKQTPPKISYDYYGVLMAYGGLQDFLNERTHEYTSALFRSRILPIYLSNSCLPHLIAAANWVTGVLASCLPQEMKSDIYSSLYKSLTMADEENCCYPVRASAAGAIAELLENDYFPPEWMSILQVLVDGINSEDESECSLFLKLLGTVIEVGQENVAIHIPLAVSNIVNVVSRLLPSDPEPWSQVVECGFSTLAVMSKIWEDTMPDEIKSDVQNEWVLGWASIARSFSNLLQRAWLLPTQITDGVASRMLPSLSSTDDASALLGLILRFIAETNEAADLRITELLAVWAELIADWDAWEEMEDLAIFCTIKDAVNLHTKCDSNNYFMQRVCVQPSDPSERRSIIEGIGSFVTHAISAYQSATYRACSAAHFLLHSPRFSFETGSIKQSLAITFTESAFSHFKSIRNKNPGLWKPLLLVICTCYVCYPENIEKVLETIQEKGFIDWASALASICTRSSEHGLSSKSEIKLAVIALVKVIERLLSSPIERDTAVFRNCFSSLLEACLHLNDVDEEDEDEDEDANSNDVDDVDDEDEEDDDDDEDSEDDELEETEEEFLDRYAKAAASLEGELVEEGDVEDEVEELELGTLDELDAQKIVGILLEKHHPILMQGQPLHPDLVTGILNAFPQYTPFFRAFS